MWRDRGQEFCMVSCRNVLEEEEEEEEEKEEEEEEEEEE